MTEYAVRSKIESQGAEVVARPLGSYSGLGAFHPLAAVCPLLLRDVDRFEILLGSLTTFVEADALAGLYLICKADEMEEIDGRVKQLPRRHQIHMVNEEDLVGHSVDVFLQTRGWIKQQILKLLFAEHVRAPFYITFDADVICCRPVSVDDLVIRGRAKASYQGKSVHPKWWQHSSAILKQPHKRDGIGHGVTPNIVSSKVVRRMIGHLGAMYGPGWIEHLCRNEGWTEYTLYSVFLENLGLLTRYHIDDRSRPVHIRHPGGNVWTADDYPEWPVERVFSGLLPGYFTVVQGTSGIAPDAIKERIRPWVSLPSSQSEPPTEPS